MNELPVRPRFELEPGEAGRLEPVAPPLASGNPRGLGTVGLVLAGLGVLLTGYAGLTAANVVAEQFVRAAWLGYVTLGVSVVGFGLIGASVLREVRGLAGLADVDRLRRELQDPTHARDAALRWLADLPEGEAIAPAIRAANDPDAIMALLQSGPGAALRGRADALGRGAAWQVFAATAAVPVPAFDGVVVAWRGIRLLREVAGLYGLRPGILGTLKLFRRVAFDAAGVVAADIATDAVARALISNPMLETLAGDMAGAGIAARRMMVLARATAAACSPLPPR